MIAIPWDKVSVPHGVLEITQLCNLSCKACYRERKDIVKSFDEIRFDLQTLENHQKIQTISIAGGEPTLHPELPRIVSMVHQRGHKVSLVTNGILLTDTLLQELATAGLDIVMVHIDEGQERPDLPEVPTIDDITRLRRHMAQRIARFGMDAGLCLTIYQPHFKNLKDLMNCLIATPEINFVFATHAIEVADIVAHSNINMQQSHAEIFRVAQTRNSDVQRFYAEHFDLQPFAYIPSRQPDPMEKPCISYYIPVVHSKRSNSIHRMRPGAADERLIRLSKKLSGRYMYYCKPVPAVIATQLIINAFATGTIWKTIRFLGKAFLPGHSLRAKRVVFENAPVVMQDGTVNCCDFCPNSTARNGKVIPVCIADHVATPT